MNTIEEIKARLDIVDLVSETVKLRHAGKNYTGFCPFHSNTRTPAFVVFPDSGTWRCFGQCNEGGDIFRFVMKKEGWDFPQTLKYLAEKAGVQLQQQTPEEQTAAEEYERLRNLLEEAATFYRHQMLQTPAGKTALDYLHKRNLTDSAIETFGLGYAPATWEAAIQYFTGKGYTHDDLVQTGLAIEKENGGLRDRFHNRITFPIRDMSGRMAGFGARILDPNDQPKFLNSPQTVLFDKSSLVYGLDQARKAIRTEDQVVIVEGYLDVIALHQAGFTNTVSPMGTALTETQLRQIKRFTRRIVLALDPDAAGQKATLRGLETARQAFDHSSELAFDARGLLRNEARLEADIRVTTLPDGLDPDEVVNRNPEEWRQILKAAKPVVEHVMETLAAGEDLEDPKAKSRVAAQVLPLIEDVVNPIERDAYRQKLARLLRVDERALLGAQPRQSLRRPPRSVVPATEAPGMGEGSAAERAVAAKVNRAADPIETYTLSVLLHNPETLYQLDRSLQEAGLTHLDVPDFQQTDHQIILRLVQESVEQAEVEPSAFIDQHTPEALAEKLHALQSAPLPKEPDQERLITDLSRAVMRARLKTINQGLNQLRFLLEDVQQQGDLRASAYAELVQQHLQTRDRLDRALSQGINKR